MLLTTFSITAVDEDDDEDDQDDDHDPDHGGVTREFILYVMYTLYLCPLVSAFFLVLWKGGSSGGGIGIELLMKWIMVVQYSWYLEHYFASNIPPKGEFVCVSPCMKDDEGERRGGSANIIVDYLFSLCCPKDKCYT
mmetsp:Transcript_16461/g.21536  ORF Transcript_16461/g.21536 Transcript_16461/m.21536 type:complete len:137 (+) Transcript_16461:61-471(+)